jgi:hypothetical protein
MFIVDKVRHKILYITYTLFNVTNSLFWDITRFSLVNVNRIFGGRYRLHLHGLTVNQARYMHEADSRQKWFLYLSLNLSVYFSYYILFSILVLYILVTSK